MTNMFKTIFTTKFLFHNFNFRLYNQLQSQRMSYRSITLMTLTFRV